MRLTLRTLLAWRDRVLLEEDQRELDQKVASAEAAQKLEERIHEVLGRHELPAPRVDGKGLVASGNSVAEYLDNALDADLLATFEANCVESDVQLCEVAECHHLLAGMTGDPQVAAELDEIRCQQLGEAIRRRLEQLAGETGHATDVANARSIRAQLDASEQAAAVTAASSSAGDGPPRRSRGPVVIAVAAVLLLGLLLGLLGLQLARTDERRPPGQQQPVAAAAAGPEGPAAAAEPRRQAPAEAVVLDADAEGDRVANGAETPAAADAVKMPQAPPPPAVIAKADTPPPEPMAEPEPQQVAETPVPPPGMPSAAASSLADRPQVPQGTAMAIAAGPPLAAKPAQTAGNPAPPAAAEPAATPPDDLPVLGFLEDDAIVGSGFVLHRPPGLSGEPLDGWECLAADSPLAEQEEVLVPPGLSPSFDIGGVRVRMRPLTHAILRFDSLGMPRVELLEGSLIARSSNEAAELGISAGGLSGIVLSGLPGGVAIAVTRVPATDRAARQATQTHLASLLPLEQQVGWRQTQAGGLPPRRLLRGIEAETTLKPLTLLEWAATSPLQAAVRPLNEPPVWASPLRRVPSLEEEASEALVAAVTADASLLKALIEMSVGGRIENRMAAVETLALTGRYDELIELLRESPATGLRLGQWEQFEARTVPPALADRTLGLAIERAFHDHIAADRAATVIGLARRNLPAATPGDLTARLIDLLEADELILRRYAYAWLKERFELDASDLIRYRADWPPEQRLEAAEWWRKQVARGLLTPRPEAAAPAG